MYQTKVKDRCAGLSGDELYKCRWRSSPAGRKLVGEADRRRRDKCRIDPACTERLARRKRCSIIKAKYGVTCEIYDAILASQQGGCAICGIKPGNRRLAIDHDHATGRVRGILCSNCNQGIGHLRDTPALLYSAAQYLESFLVLSSSVPFNQPGQGQKSAPN